MSERRRVLITGSSGLLGTILRQSLGEKHDLRGVDVMRARGFAARKADATKLRAIQPAFEGVDVVIDLAGDANPRCGWERVHENNIKASVNVLEAARRAGAKRVIFASSNRVTGMYEREHPYSAIVAGIYEGLDPATVPRLAATVPPRPDTFYAVGKLSGEAAGRYYSDEYGLSVICLRLGTVNEANRPRGPRQFATLLTHRDFVHLVECCIAASADINFAVTYGVSDNKWRFWDIEAARGLLGYEPQDDAEQWREDRIAPD